MQRRGAASYSMRDRIHVQNAKQNAVMMCAIFFFFSNVGTILFWPISLLIISSGSSGLFTFGCFILCLFESLSRDKLEKGPSKFPAYIRNTIPAKSLWPPSEERPPPLPLFQCCYNDVDFSFDIFLNLQNNIWQGVWGKRKPLSNVIVWDCSFYTWW